MIETMVSALLVVILAIGVYAGLDSASAVTGTNKTRAVASSIGQADQERLHAYRVSDLSNLRQTRTQTTGGTIFTIVSRADWITDSSGTQSCSGPGKLANYIKTTSTVTWPNMRISPIVLDSLIAPPNGSFNSNQGTLAVQIRNRSANGIPGVGVSLTGPSSFSDTTNSLGCILAGYLTAGTYTVAFSLPGYVDPDGTNAISKQVGVVPEQTTTSAFDYDLAGSTSATFQTQPYTLPVQAASAQYLSVAQPGLAAPGFRAFGNGTWQTGLSAPGLFPFTSPYGVYAGNCGNADPQTYSQPRDTVQINPGAAAGAVVWVPALNINVTRSGSAYANARVRVYNMTAGCTGTLTMTTSSAGRMRLPTSPLAQQDPGLPYGTYTVCADDGTRSITVNNVANTVKAGTSLVNMAIPTSGAGSTCP